MKHAIGMLIVNDLKRLPILTLKTILKQTQAPIIIGYLNENDIINLPKNTQINYIKLNSNEVYGNGIYHNFGTDSFYDLVTLKWVFFERLLELNYDFFIYNDVDVVWSRDAGHQITKCFHNFISTDIYVQSFTRDPSSPLLCMGFFAFNKSTFSKSFIANAKKRHSKSRNDQDPVGDDEIVTQLFRELQFTGKIRELPQSTFAVGNFLDLFMNKSSMPGVNKPIPIIFHANYVVGLTNKIIMLKLFLGQKYLEEIGEKMTFREKIYLYLKRFKNWFK